MPSLVENRTAAHASTRIAGNFKNRPGYQEFIPSSRMPLANRSDAHSDVTAYGISNGMASARGSGGSKCWGLCGFADQYAVGGRSCAGPDAEQGIEGSMAWSAPIEAEHELVEVMLEVCFPQSVIDAQTPALEV